MPYPMFLRRWALFVALSAGLLLAETAAADVRANLRVEGPATTLDPGSAYSTGTEHVMQATRTSCESKDERARMAGPTAFGIVQTAIESGRPWADDLRPLRVRTFSGQPGFFACRIGDYTGSDSGFWLYTVNHVFASVSADQYRLKEGDDVLWYFADFGLGINTGEELGLTAPRRADAGDPFRVKVVAFAGDGSRSPVGGAIVRGGDGPVTTNGRGRARVVASEPGRIRLRATHSPDIPSGREIVRVR